MPVTAPLAPHGPARGLNALGGVSEHIYQVLQNNNANMAMLGIPPQPEPEDGLWEDVAVPQARARRKAWINSVLNASQKEYLRFRFPRQKGEEPLSSDLQALDQLQKPGSLRNWVNSLVQAKKENARPEKRNLIIPGTIGSGKSAMACAVGNEAVERGLGVLYVKHSTYVTWLRPDSAPGNLTAEKVRRLYATCDLLILDEVCGGMNAVATDFVEKESTDLIDARNAAGRATLYTTNLRGRRKPDSPNRGLAIVDILGGRFVSRMEEAAHVLRVVGPDRRQPEEPLDW
ncbi:ATP-binding protein [Streptomyces zaomyceticus]|uniref:ATP-binding protein n=1 Tax=Streptomyces zaomyceticus TaxID=68286 RepID=UPI002E1E3794